MEPTIVFAAGLIAGCIVGVGGMAIIAVNRKLPQDAESIFQWFNTMPPDGADRELYHLVKRYYGGKRTIHRCPVRKEKAQILGLPPVQIIDGHDFGKNLPEGMR